LFRLWKRRRSKASRTEMGRGINGKGMGSEVPMFHSLAVHSPAFTSGSVALRLSRAVLFCGYRKSETDVTHFLFLGRTILMLDGRRQCISLLIH
jgi:hypothetical protein